MSIKDSEITAVVQRTFRLAERIAPIIQDAVVPIWCDNHNGGRSLIGTAFFAEKDQRSFLVTALHNFEKNPQVILKIDFLGLIRNLNEMAGRTAPEDDLWVAEADSELHQKLQAIKVPLLNRENPKSCRFGTGTVFIGFPEDLNLQGEPFKSLSISTMFEMRNLNTGIDLPEALVFDVNCDVLSTVEGTPVMHRPDVFGMSGGPAFGWHCPTNPASGEQEFHFFLQGVIVSWQRIDGYIVACNASRIAALAATL